MSETATKAGLYAALAKAQAEYGTVDRTATNPHFKSKYAPLDKVLDAITPALTNNGLCRYWRHGMAKDGEFVVVTVTAGIAHGESGESIESSLSWGVPDDVQKLGSALTYMRRYTMEAVAGVAADSDDDGNGASGESTPARAASKTAGNKPALNAALDKGKANRDDEATGNFIAALESIGWDIEAFSAELVKFAGIKVPAKIAKPFSAWDEWIKVKARELFAAIDADQREKGPTPAKTEPAAAAGIPDDDIPF